MTLRLISNVTDATVITGTIGGYLVDMLPTWAAAAALLLALIRIGQALGLWKRPPQ